MDIFIDITLGLLLLTSVGLAIVFWESQRPSKMIGDWAGEHGYTVLEKKQPLVNLGPFRWENPRGRTFYHITVRDSQSQEYGGWVCCGAEWLGLLSNRVEVRWDENEPLLAAPQLRQAEEGVWPPPPIQ